MHPGELRELLLLRSLPGIGDLRFGALLQAYGSPRAALGDAAALGDRAAAALRSSSLRDRIERSAQSVERDCVAVITVIDPEYPAVLRQLHDPPGVLFARGDISLAAAPGVAVVGSRKATPYGRDATHLLATGLARAGYVIISGLAQGIDRAAHEAALSCGGRTIGVVGCGIDVVYPRGHGALQERIAAEGLLLSEFLPGDPPRGHNFPKRNRIIAALSRGVLVVEAAMTSGAMRTVDSALELGRDVFAVPGPIGRETSEGTNHLIQSGAALVASVPDLLAELQSRGAPAAAAGADSRGGTGVAFGSGSPQPADERREQADDLGAAEIAGRRRIDPTGVTSDESGRGRDGGRVGDRRNGWRRVRERRTPALGAGTTRPENDAVVAALGRDALHVDAVAAAAGLASAVALTALLELELDGRVVRLPGMRFACR